MSFFDDPMAFFVALPALAVPLFVFVAAFLEYVAPPFPGDSCLLVGFFLAGQGGASAPAVFLAAVLGSVVGGMVAFQLGARYGETLLERVLWRRGRWAGLRFRQLVGKHGESVLLVNRFLPVVRGVMLYGAGAFKLRFRTVMLYNTVCAGAFVALLFGVGQWTAGSWTDLQARFGDLNRGAGLVALVLVGLWLAWSRRRSVRAEAAVD